MRRKLLGNEHADVAATHAACHLLIETGDRGRRGWLRRRPVRTACWRWGVAHRRTAASSAQGAAWRMGHTTDAEKLLLEGFAGLRADRGVHLFRQQRDPLGGQKSRRHGNALEASKYWAILRANQKKNREPELVNLGFGRCRWIVGLNIPLAPDFVA